MPSDLPHRFPVRVYYEDTDFSGAVYHASYLRFLERGRTEWLRSLGIEQSRLASGAEAFGFVVRHMDIDFRKPARMDDLLSVETLARKIGGASLDLGQRLLRGEEPLVTAEVRIGCVARGRPIRLPTAIRAKIAG